MRVFRVLPLLTLIFLLIKPAVALPQVRIADVVGNPSHYHDMRVKIIGEVTKIEPDPQTPNGAIYTIQDTSDQALHVRSLAAPELESKVYVVGTVTQDDETAKPYLVEITHGVPGPPLNMLYGIGGILVVLAIVLAYYVLNPKPVKRSFQRPEPETVVKRRPVITQVFRDDPVALLLATSGSHKGKAFNIYNGTNTIGRDDNQTVQLTDDGTISRSHASIQSTDSKMVIKNHSTTNPLRLNGEEVEEREIKDGDIIQIGATRLRVTLFGGEQSDDPNDR